MAIYSGFSHETWWFSIAMLVYQRVYGYGSKPCTPAVHTKIAGIYGCSSPFFNGIYRYWFIATIATYYVYMYAFIYKYIFVLCFCVSISVMFYLYVDLSLVTSLPKPCSRSPSTTRKEFEVTCIQKGWPLRENPHGAHYVYLPSHLLYLVGDIHWKSMMIQIVYGILMGK